jgi:DNA-binding transcriptional MerR regulator
MQAWHCPRFTELPDIYLYKDQVVETLNAHLTLFFSEADRPVTDTMINNYVKLKVLPPPVRKKYSREQLAQLFMICLLKQVLSIADIRTLLASASEAAASPAACYDAFCDALELALRTAFGSPCASEVPLPKVEHRALFSAVYAFACRQYTVKSLGAAL